MTDYAELKRLLDGCKESSCADAEDFGRRISDLYEYLDPETVAEMVAEIEALKGPHDWLAEDLIKELVDNARAFQNNSDHGEDDPFAIVLLAAASRIRRQEVNVDQLKAENEALREEVALDDKLIADRDRLLNMFECPVHGQCIPYAMDQVEALRKDAERYQWLRSRESADDPEISVTRWTQLAPNSAVGETPRLEVLDAAIDAAMGKGEKP